MLESILNDLHFMLLKCDQMRVAPTFGLIGPGLAHPWVAVLVDFLDHKDFANHRHNVGSFLGG